MLQLSAELPEKPFVTAISRKIKTIHYQNTQVLYCLDMCCLGCLIAVRGNFMDLDFHQLLAEYPLETLLQTIPTGLFLVNSDKKIVYWNAEASRITGYSAAEAVGQHCSFLQGVPCYNVCALFSGEPSSPDSDVPCSFRHKNGKTITLTKNVDLLRNADGDVIGGIEAFVDVTRLKEHETSLRAAVEERTYELELEKAGLRAVLDGMVDPTYICDSNYHISFVNRAMEDMVGNVDHKFCYQLIYDKQEVCSDCPLQQVLAGQIVRQEKTLPETGRTYEIVHSPYPLAKNPTHKLGVSRDITDRIEIRRQLQQTNSELDAFVSTVSHDLRSPLTPLIGFADLLEDRYSAQLDDIGRDSIAEIKKTAEKMKDLLEGLLSLSRVGQLKFPNVPIDATAVAEDAMLELADKVLEQRAKIKIESLPEILLPEPLLADLFRNLLANALKYACGHNPCIEVTGKKFIDRVRYKVIDHGLGVDKSEYESIFEPFNRGSSSDGHVGTGIGLATVAKIAIVAGGSAWVEETPGGGATFVVDLPVDSKEDNRTDSV